MTSILQDDDFVSPLEISKSKQSGDSGICLKSPHSDEELPVTSSCDGLGNIRIHF